jgi:hypothetical protein
MILAGNAFNLVRGPREQELLRGLPDRTGRDDAGLETCITRVRDALDVKVILGTDRLLLRECVEDTAQPGASPALTGKMSVPLISANERLARFSI